MRAMEPSAGARWRPSVSVHLRMRVAADRQDSLHKFLEDAIPFYESPGGIRVSLWRDSSAADRFIELVEYVDEQAYRRDEERINSDPVMIQFLARWRELLAEPAVVEVYREAMAER